MNPWTRRTALYAIGIIAIPASADALAHSYTGLYEWAVHHQLGGWQALSWPTEIGAPVMPADRITAATSPLAAFAGVMIRLLVLKMSHRPATAQSQCREAPAPSCETAGDAIPLTAERGETVTALSHHAQPSVRALLANAAEIYRAAHATDGSKSQRALAAQLRERGRRFSNGQLRTLAATVARLEFDSQAA